MTVITVRSDPQLASVHLKTFADGSSVEMVESIQPPVPREEKWVLIVSTLKGCPVACPMCDAGGVFGGKLSAAEILEQIDYLIVERFPDRAVPIAKLKVQFARMGEPAYNDAVLEVLRELPRRYDAPGLMPCVSSVAPRGRERFFTELRTLKNELYPQGRFQLQFSVHTTDDQARRTLVPASTWSLEEMGRYGQRFVAPGDRRVTLNFAPVRGLPLDPIRLRRVCSPDTFLVKLTPLNPTRAAASARLVGLIDPAAPCACEEIAARFRAVGYDTLVSIGELRENDIGSNCGMYVKERESQATGSARPSMRKK
jgi:23S rRNA (adenine2503-C2)-methyltransferase